MNREMRDAVIFYVRGYVIFVAAILLVAVVSLAGCAGVQQKTFADQLGLAYSTITSTAEAIEAACRNTEPGGPCDPLSPIKTEDKDRAALILTDALDTLDAARVLYDAGNEYDASNRLRQAQALLRIAEGIIAGGDA